MHHYTVQDYKPVIEWFYQAEPEEFFTSYHKRGGTVKQCVDSTVDTISYNAEFYVVESEGCMAAFFVKTLYNGTAVLEGFHVLPAFRTPLFIENFWDLVRSVFAQDIYIGIYTGNQPALKHLVRNGFVQEREIESHGKTFILLRNKLSDTCH